MALRELHKILTFEENSAVTSQSPEEDASILSVVLSFLKMDYICSLEFYLLFVY